MGHSISWAARVFFRPAFSGSKRTVIDGPFTETKELVAGFWLIQVKSKEEAIEWIKRAPNPMPGTESEIRQVFEEGDFADLAAKAPEVFEAKRRFREDQEAKHTQGQPKTAKR